MAKVYKGGSRPPKRTVNSHAEVRHVMRQSDITTRERKILRFPVRGMSGHRYATAKVKQAKVSNGLASHELVNAQRVGGTQADYD